MKHPIKKTAQFLRRVMTRVSSLLMLFQKTPLVQMLLPEAQLLGNAHVLNATAVTIATIAGLGAYDSVSGATAVAQTSPSSGSSTVSATSGTNLVFLVQITGAGGNTPASWSVAGTLPTGLTHTNAKNSKTDSITGIPTQSGSFPITITAWENSNFTGRSASGSFTINVAGPPVISSQPASISIVAGTSTTLQVTASGGTGISYQWYQGNSGVTTTPVGTNVRTFTTPILSESKNYWVKVANTAFPSGTNSATAIVTVLTPVTITSPPASSTILTGTSTTLSVVAAGSGPFTYQWYRGDSGTVTNPVGSNSPSFNTPILAAAEKYWVKVTNAASPGGVSSPTATITVKTSYQLWADAQFSPAQLLDQNLTSPSGDADGDGITNEAERIFGISPVQSQASLLAIHQEPAQLVLNFTAKSTAGSSDAASQRHYAVETLTDLASGQWQPLSGYSDLVGNDATVQIVLPNSNGKIFYRLKAWLQP